MLKCSPIYLSAHDPSHKTCSRWNWRAFPVHQCPVFKCRGAMVVKQIHPWASNGNSPGAILARTCWGGTTVCYRSSQVKTSVSVHKVQTQDDTTVWGLISNNNDTNYRSEGSRLTSWWMWRWLKRMFDFDSLSCGAICWWRTEHDG